jgi:hypothetical protein
MIGKSARATALHQTLRGKTETVAPVEADCVANPIACGTSGFLRGKSLVLLGLEFADVS